MLTPPLDATAPKLRITAVHTRKAKRQKRRTAGRKKNIQQYNLLSYRSFGEECETNKLTPTPPARFSRAPENYMLVAEPTGTR